MKKTKWLLATVCIAVLLAGCSNVTKNNTEPESDPKPEITIPEGTLLTEKPADYNDAVAEEEALTKILGTWVAITKVTPPDRVFGITAACNTRQTMTLSDASSDRVTLKQEIDAKPIVTAYAEKNNKTKAESWGVIKKTAAELFSDAPHAPEFYDNGYIFVMTFDEGLPSVYFHETDKNSFVVDNSYGDINDWVIYTKQ